MSAVVPSLPLAAFTCRLPKRSLIRVSGADTREFLQGLFTNDVNALQPGGSMWGCFLYFTGRVMCDAYLYNDQPAADGAMSVLVDVHEDMCDTLQDHLLEMKMRKKVVIDDVSEKWAVAAALRCSTNSSSGGVEAAADGGARLAEANAKTFLDARNFALFGGQPQQSSSPSSSSWVLHKKVMPSEWAPSLQPVFTDASSTGAGASDSGDAAVAAVAKSFREEPYRTLLLANGIGEGPAVFRDNKTLPFELNVDYLAGVHFNKGCYVGQELTHRTHVMLVTRKRSVPLFLPPAPGAADVVQARRLVGEGLYASGGRDKVGELTAGEGPFALGLLRLRYVDKETHTIADLSLKDGQPVMMHIPSWWPPKQVKKLLKNN